MVVLLKVFFVLVLINCEGFLLTLNPLLFQSFAAFCPVLRIAVEDEITDVIVAVGEVPLLRFSNRLMPIKRDAPLTAAETEAIAHLLLVEKDCTEIDDLNEA